MLSSSVKEAWQVNTRVNRVVLEHLTSEMLEAQTPGRGFSVAQHLAEIIYSPIHFGMKFDAERLGSLPEIYEETEDSFVVNAGLTQIRELAETSAGAVLAAVEAATGKGDLPHTSLDAYLVHMMVHDAHHRGQIMLALKTSGYPLPSEDAVWSPWRGG